MMSEHYLYDGKCHTEVRTRIGLAKEEKEKIILGPLFLYRCSQIMSSPGYEDKSDIKLSDREGTFSVRRSSLIRSGSTC